MTTHAKKAREFLRDDAHANWQDKALWVVRQKRDTAASSVKDWEELRDHASQIKENVLSQLGEYLLQFEENALKNGAQVHWADDAEEFNTIVLDIARNNKVLKIVKSKSMLTEECGLNPFLEKHALEVTDTDLGERIIQLRNEPPSHIVLPAIHLKKEEVGKTFHEKLNTEKGNNDPQYLTEAARKHLRQKFLEADMAITGVNFAVAETGKVVVCTNEGNADMGIHAAKVQVHCMGIEKIIPRTSDLGIFTRLLARSATGQPITTYTSHYRKPGPDNQMHIVIVDNGRSKILADRNQFNSLKCIRCGACMNTCPVYRRSGGHSYGSVIPGPIGSILSPSQNLKQHKDLPFASTLCGSCSDICPVKIDIHNQLYRWRQEIAEQKQLAPSESMMMTIMGKILASNTLYNSTGTIARFLLRILPRPMVYNSLNIWGRDRELPEPGRQSFKEWYRKNRRYK